MAINYPNGKKFSPPKNQPVQPVQKKKKDISFSNRGKTLEDELNETNSFYLQRGLAVIHKKPVPVQIVRVEYPSRSAAVIREAYFQAPSTTDYNGIWQGRYIDFEAKETEIRTSFPLKNIHEHQVHHMADIIRHGGLAFLIIRFSSLDRYFVLPFETLETYWKRMVTGGRKSMTLAEVEESSVEVKPGAFPRIDYLSVLHQLMK
ncbi:Holliday junction resolvase RecU [Planococcus maitriensis]|uniref:Holliday junction resolvase RecU n=1 Tax=Planococcus maitriensis TaxID=221799 RepID=A0A365KC23_9BACL|nr:Holliday junction resolvase RecU [Planococcus maitriensis]RAZ70207.1 Holliday junction resolvase RecU [Planococcus maitriensis]